MKKILLATAVVASLVGCASKSNERFDRKADTERERMITYNERAVSEAPKWMSKLPESKEAVYANGTATATQLYAAWRDVCVAQEEYERDGWSASVNELTARALVWTVSAVPAPDVVAEAAADAAVELTRPEGRCFAEPVERARAAAIHAAQTIKFCEMFLMDEPPAA